jgi:CRP-like cAMP-binding protein
MDQPPTQFRNHLLGTLKPDDLAALTPHLTFRRFPTGENFDQTDKPISTLLCPEKGNISMVVTTDPAHRIEAGLIGYEGMTGTAAVLGDDRSCLEVNAQVEGEGHVISADRLQQAMAERPAIQRRLQLFAHALHVQTAHTAWANGLMKIEARLARWLLMAQDRLQSPEVHLTHEFLSNMLGVRRAGVTDTLHMLEGYGVIRAQRAVILVKDRARLEALAAPAYGAPEAVYRRLLGDPFVARPSSGEHAQVA